MRAFLSNLLVVNGQPAPIVWGDAGPRWSHRRGDAPRGGEL